MIPVQLTVFFMIVYVLESLTIILQSGLLVAVLGREWVQVKRLSAVDMILTSLGICHFCLQWASMLNNFYSYFNPNYVFWSLSIAWDFLNTLSFWLTSLLAVVYCVKISSFTHPIFLWLRWRILRLVPRLLLGSLLLSCVTLICSAVRNHIKIKMISMEHFPRNNTMIERLKMLLQKFTLSQPMVVMIIPFLLFLASTILLMASLSQHLGQMQHHKAGHSNSSTKAHSTALRSLAVFLIFFTSYFLTIVISFMSILYDKSSWYWVWEAVIYAIVSVQSTLLMLSSPTLKKVLKLRCWVLETA